LAVEELFGDSEDDQDVSEYGQTAQPNIGQHKMIPNPQLNTSFISNKSLDASLPSATESSSSSKSSSTGFRSFFKKMMTPSEAQTKVIADVSTAISGLAIQTATVADKVGVPFVPTVIRRVVERAQTFTSSQTSSEASNLSSQPLNSEASEVTTTAIEERSAEIVKRIEMKPEQQLFKKLGRLRKELRQFVDVHHLKESRRKLTKASNQSMSSSTSMDSLNSVHTTMTAPEALSYQYNQNTVCNASHHSHHQPYNPPKSSLHQFPSVQHSSPSQNGNLHARGIPRSFSTNDAFGYSPTFSSRDSDGDSIHTVSPNRNRTPTPSVNSTHPQFKSFSRSPSHLPVPVVSGSPPHHYRSISPYTVPVVSQGGMTGSGATGATRHTSDILLLHHHPKHVQFIEEYLQPLQNYSKRQSLSSMRSSSLDMDSPEFQQNVSAAAGTNSIRRSSTPSSLRRPIIVGSEAMHSQTGGSKWSPSRTFSVPVFSSASSSNQPSAYQQNQHQQYFSQSSNGNSFGSNHRSRASSVASHGSLTGGKPYQTHDHQHQQSIPHQLSYSVSGETRPSFISMSHNALPPSAPSTTIRQHQTTDPYYRHTFEINRPLSRASVSSVSTTATNASSNPTTPTPQDTFKKLLEMKCNALAEAQAMEKDTSYENKLSLRPESSGPSALSTLSEAVYSFASTMPSSKSPVPSSSPSIKRYAAPTQSYLAKSAVSSPSSSQSSSVASSPSSPSSNKSDELVHARIAKLQSKKKIRREEDRVWLEGPIVKVRGSQSSNV
jgi:hypothetical protein